MTIRGSRFASYMEQVVGTPRLSMNVTVAISALRINTLRTVLSMLGVIIGVASVILIALLGEGAKNQVRQSMNAMGGNMAVVTAVPDGASSAFGRASGRLTERDGEEIARKVPGAISVSPQIRVYAALDTSNGQIRANAIGITPSYLQIATTNLAAGRVPTELEFRSRALVTVIGSKIAERLFKKGATPLGQMVRVNRVPFKVIGVMRSKGESLVGDMDNIILVPLTSARQRLKSHALSRPDDVDVIYVQFRQDKVTAEGIDSIKILLRRKYHVRSGEIDPFTIVSTEEFAKQAQSVIQVFQLGLIAIASISLLVGGIGITNILLVSITERTREIGIRMALGANPADIRNQFLVESAILCLFGGVLGSLVGVGLASIVTTALEWSTSANPLVIMGALGFSVAVGLVAGTYPAIKASRLAPIEALRYE